jgi:hypothetical protein
MLIHGACQSVELANMVETEPGGHTTAEAPLLVASNAEDNQDDVGTPQGNRSVNRSGSKFIWALTCSTGISGLLFGYEYVL